jgi:spore germination protein GerM
VSRRLLAGLAGLVVVLAACGVPGDGAPHELDAKNVPYKLLAPTAENTTTTQPSAFTATSRVKIYLADADGKLEAVSRQVTAPSTAARSVESLLKGPSKEEADELHSAITTDTRLLGVDGPTDGLVTLDLSHDLLDITGRQQILALAQVVYTATELPSVDRVLFQIDGENVEVPNGNGKLTASPLGRLSYRDLLANR